MWSWLNTLGGVMKDKNCSVTQRYIINTNLYFWCCEDHLSSSALLTLGLHFINAAVKFLNSGWYCRVIKNTFWQQANECHSDGHFSPLGERWWPWLCATLAQLPEGWPSWSVMQASDHVSMPCHLGSWSSAYVCLQPRAAKPRNKSISVGFCWRTHADFPSLFNQLLDSGWAWWWIGRGWECHVQPWGIYLDGAKGFRNSNQLFVSQASFHRWKTLFASSCHSG